MSTRAQVRFATRKHGISFSEHPEKIHAQFYVHSDGYPEGLGCQIAESLLKVSKLEGWELEHVDSKHGDLEYIYYVWQDQGKSVWISIFEDKDYLRDDGSTYPLSRECIFVGTPEMLLEKYDENYKLNTNDDG
jgi:hypothetical protein